MLAAGSWCVGPRGCVLGAFLLSEGWVWATAPVGAWDPLRGLAVAENVGTPRRIGAPATEGRSADPRPSRGSREAHLAVHGPRASHAGLVVPHPDRNEPPLARGARVPLPIRPATTSHRRMESRRELFGGHTVRCDAHGTPPRPARQRERLPGRASRERPSVAGALTPRGAPMFAATARPRRG